MSRFFLLFVMIVVAVTPVMAGDMEITPFRTVNQSPLVQIYGIPSESSATVAPLGRIRFSLTQDLANSYSNRAFARERITMDGESYRWTLAGRYGITSRIELGVELPYVIYGGGFMDGFIDSFHRALDLPRGGREAVPRDRLIYSYSRDGVQRLNMGRSGSGVGDISLTSGIRLYDRQDSGSHDSLAVRTSIKLPTGDSSSLRGSGSTDFALSLCGSMNSFTEWGALGLFGSLGGMAMTNGEVLRDQQNNLAAFGTFGIGWGPYQWLSLKMQLNGHTPMYRGSSLKELSKNTLMLVSGFAVKLPGAYVLDLGLSEDLIVATSPDVAFHIGLSKQF